MPVCPQCQHRGETLFEACPTGDGFHLVGEEDWKEGQSDRWIGRKLGDRFVVAGIIGKGSMGYVYKAFQEQVDRMVAIKLFEVGEDGRSEGNRKRFVQEARVLAQIGHPNCVTLYDFGYHEGGKYLYIAMEYVAGISLRKAVRRGLKLDAVMVILRQVLTALREAHALEIVHRDLKPENIILSYRKTSDEQVVKVLDFGIAKLLQKGQAGKTRAGLLFGTPAYMSPEQCLGSEEITAASDIYSLGCMAFEMITGKLPFQAESPREMVRMQINDPPPSMETHGRMEVHEELQRFVRNCLAKDPAGRYADASEALRAFEASVRGRGEASKEGPSTEELRRRVMVPEHRISGVELDPVGRERRESMQEERPARSVQVGEGGRVQGGLGPLRSRAEEEEEGRTKLLLMAVLALGLFVALVAALVLLV